MIDNSCVCCGAVIPEGRQVCPVCEARAYNPAKFFASERADDPVNHPAHYTAGGVECIDAIQAALTCQTDPYAAWLTGQIIKYIWRWPMKNGAEDLRKAAFYLKKLIDNATDQLLEESGFEL